MFLYICYDVIDERTHAHIEKFSIYGVQPRAIFNFFQTLKTALFFAHSNIE